MSYITAVSIENVQYAKTYKCEHCNNIKTDIPWVNYDIDNKCICSYLCYKNKNKIDTNLWSKVNNKDDFNYLCPILPKKKEEFVFLTEKELMNFKDNELNEYFINMNEYYFKNPERASLQMTIMEEGYDTSESDYDNSDTDSDDYYSDF